MPSSPIAQAWRNIASPSDACHVLREAQRRAGFLQRLLEHAAPADQLDAAQVLSLKPEEIEGVEAGRRLAVAAEQLVKVRQAVEAVRHGLAVEHDALEGEGAHGLGDGDELGRPVAAVRTTGARARRPCRR